MVGKHLFRWTATKGGFASEDGTPMNSVWAMNRTLIPDAVQGQPAASPSECACRCAWQPHCVGYTWLGANQTCWMLDQVFFSVPGDQDEHPDTVVGRVDTGEPTGGAPALDAAWIHMPCDKRKRTASSTNGKL